MYDKLFIALITISEAFLPLLLRHPHLEFMEKRLARKSNSFQHLHVFHA